MRKTIEIPAIALCIIAFVSSASPREKQSTPALELLNAARLADLRMAGDQSFKVHAIVKLEHKNGVEEEGTYLLVWGSSTRWREEFSFPDFHQLRISGSGGVWEERQPYFLSLRGWQLMQALDFYGRFKLQEEESAGKIKRTKKNGADLRCIKIAWHSAPVRESCFREQVVQLASEHYLPSDRWYEFSDYLTIRTKFFPGHIRVFDGKTLVADFSVSKVEETDSVPISFFEQPAKAEWRPWCASPDLGGDPLTPIYSTMTQKKGVATLYGVIGTDGRWRSVHILESGGPAHDAEVFEALKKERWKPSSCSAVPVVVETVFQR